MFNLKALSEQFMPILTGKRKPSLEDLQRMTELASKAGAWLRDFLPLGPEVVQLLTYGEAIAYFVEHRPADASVVKGAMLLQDHAEGRMLFQMFLDKDSALACDSGGKPYGRRLVVKALDPELEQTFGGKDLVVLE
jgi:hypothetical protein